MPKDNNQQPITPTTNSGDDQFPVFVEETLPPMPQETPTTPDVPPAPEKKDLTPTETPIATSGSAAPQDDAIMPPTVTSKNKKKFAGGKVIATILGLFLLVGGVGAGVLLVNQNQNISEKASNPDSCSIYNETTCNNNSSCDWKPEVTSQCGASNCLATGGSYTPGCISTSVAPAHCDGIQSCQDLDKFECIGVCVWVEESKPLCKGAYVVTKGECYSTTEQVNECISDGKCLGPGDSCCSGLNEKFDNTCNVTETRCTSPTISKKGLGESCTLNIQCESNLCSGGICLGPEGYECNSNNQCLSNVCTSGICRVGTNIDCSQIQCTDTSCTVGGAYSSQCYLNHYICDENTDLSGGCNENPTAGQSATFTADCGSEQIDIYCPDCGRTGNTTTPVNKYDYISKIYPNACPTDEPPVDSVTASCSNIKVYTDSWSLIEEANLSSLSVGDNIKFCVNGVSSSGSFDMARITANGASLGETQEKRPGTNDFCSSYTIPAGTTTFNITSQIHHISEGWK